MFNLLMRFLPADTRALLQLAMRMGGRLDTPEERQRVAEYGLAAFRNDGKISITEFTRLGKMLGILTAPKRRKKPVVSVMGKVEA
jgi:hypothetical protein